MRKFRFLQEILVGACVRFTALAVCLMILRIIDSGGSANGSISILSFLLLFPCGLCIAAARSLRKTSLSPALFRLFHFIITWLSVFFFLWLPAQNGGSTSRNLIALTVIALLYWVIFLVAKLIVSRFRGFREED
ncbi:MAG: hypothetical protein II955_06415 [Clostridia bacterium]|nr:hypothetical protein [Clostridia bacterium]MBQ3640134.1 hypothetical protein [Clostridia bacterium]